MQKRLKKYCAAGRSTSTGRKSGLKIEPRDASVRLEGLGLSEGSAEELIARWRCGDAAALRALLPLIYDELRRVARKHLRRERVDHTLQTTALIHAAYLRLVGGAGAEVRDHCDFVALASRLMTCTNPRITGLPNVAARTAPLRSCVSRLARSAMHNRIERMSCPLHCSRCS